MTKTDLLKRLKALGRLTPEQRNDVTCSLIGHSRIQTHCMGYYYCGRCGAQLGDSLGSVYPQAEKVVVVSDGNQLHSAGCKTCEANYKELTWRDKVFAPNPFLKKKGKVQHGKKAKTSDQHKT